MFRILLAVLVAGAVVGCGKKNTAKKPGGGGDEAAARRGEPTAAQRTAGNDLKALTTAYHDYMFKHNKPPTSVADLSAFASGDLIAKVQSGTYTLYMNVDVYKTPAGSVFTVLGFERGVPTDGGVVVMADGSTPYMSKEEFAAAAKGGQ